MHNEEIAGLDFSDWPVPDKFLIEVGRVAALWASLESFLSFCIQKLAGFNDLNDPKPFILLAHTNFPQRLDMLGALCEHLFPNFCAAPSIQGCDFYAPKSASESQPPDASWSFSRRGHRSRSHGGRVGSRNLEDGYTLAVGRRH